MVCWLVGFWLVGWRAGLHKYYWMDLSKTCQEDRQLAKEEPVKFRCAIQIKKWIQN